MGSSVWTTDAPEDDSPISLEVGHGEIDRRRGEIFSQVAAVKELMGDAPRSKEVLRSMRLLLARFREHCAFEEELMEQLGYPHFERHREDHRRHIEEGTRLLWEFETQNDGRARRMYDCWEGWSVAHYLGEDLELGRFLRAARRASA